MKVLCIDDNFLAQKSRKEFQLINQFPLQGETYTVIKQSIINGIVGFVLNELDNSNGITFNAKRFVLIQEDACISCFEQLTEIS